MLLNNLYNKKLIHPPKFVIDNTCYLTITGSESYGVSSGNSDRDICGITIPPKVDVFPHLRGEIQGFGKQINRFEVFQEHHISTDEYNYDVAIYSIIKNKSIITDDVAAVLVSVDN